MQDRGVVGPEAQLTMNANGIRRTNPICCLAGLQGNGLQLDTTLR